MPAKAEGQHALSETALAGCWRGPRHRQRPGGVGAGQAFILEGLASGALSPVIAKTFALDDVQDAHRFLEANQQVGKVVVTV
ncbi:zinc-binding dehydrogenase [Pseudomonas sp. 18175]|uniref:zinc-binding dehydrogenase n=1 Tax=Pseudomonas sp. 18175 TaxID=3390056 RepID=UPI003D1A746F